MNASSSSLSSVASAEGALILVLPQEVVDRIAAGEVVQRPSAVVKECLENALDATATEIVIATEAGGLQKIIITDNGCGIGKVDLAKAAQRFATSKLQTTADFDSLTTFGFRGEALSSISMVARLSLTSRTATAQAAYKMTYKDGRPDTAPTACARKVGTTVVVQDLFYNVPHRQTLRAADEYAKILAVVQHYAVQYAAAGIGMVCQKSASGGSKKIVIDLNTTNLPAVQALKATVKRQCTAADKNNKDDDESMRKLRAAATKQVITHVFGSQLEHHLHAFECQNKAEPETSLPASAGDKEEPLQLLQPCTYTCQGYLTSPSFSNSKRSQLVLFVNDRLVECNTLKRALDEVYGNFTKAKPFLYLSLHVPAAQVDVNIHPTKREVAMLFVDDICRDIASHLRQTLSAQSQNFAPQSVGVVVAATTESAVSQTNLSKRKRESKESTSTTKDDATRMQSSQQPLLPLPKKVVAPSKLIRTTRGTQSGALEPFLVSTQSQLSASSQRSLSQLQSSQASVSQSQDPSPSQSSSSLSASADRELSSLTQHDPGCPLATRRSVDMTQPGAFAAVVARCTCVENPADDTLVVRLPRQAVMRPKKVLPTACNYSSVVTLRKRIQKQADGVLLKQLRGACFVGVVSRCRSLLQCGEDLVLLNHYECARELFYQLALMNFGGGSTLAKLGNGGCGGVDVQAVIAQVVQLEDELQNQTYDEGGLKQLAAGGVLLPVCETNRMLAEQATACLMDNAEMLEEYFSVAIEKNDEDRIILTGLPVLLEGHTPLPHALPLFLLRLATEVEWSEERLCFQGICRELGAFYAELPSGDMIDAHIQHQVFPAITSLLVPSERLKIDGTVSTLTKLSKLYRVFERC